MAEISTGQPFGNGDVAESANTDMEAGPLSSLRISSMAKRDSGPESNLKMRPYRQPAKYKRSKKIRARSKVPDAGFGFDLDLPTVLSAATSVELQETSKSQSSQLATIFLNSSKAYTSRYNIIDPLKSKDSAKGASSSDRARVQVSRSTQERAETVKLCFHIKYLWLERALETHVGDSNFLQGIDGIYNPLQTIRNRLVRQNVHQQPHPKNYKTPPLACDAFSSHNSPGKFRWRLLWGIDVNELTFDIVWRKMFWYELRNPQGELWFPRASRDAETSSRLYDRLWTGSDASGEYLDKPSSHISIKATPTKHKRKSLKERAKRFYASSYYNSTSDSDTADHSFGHLPASTEALAKLKLGHVHRPSLGHSADRYQFEVSRSSDFVANPRRGSSKSVSSEDRIASTARPPLIVIGHESDVQHSRSNSAKVSSKYLENPETEQIHTINDVNFNFGRHDKSSVMELEFDDNACESVTTPKEEACDAEEQVLISIKSKTNYLQSLMFVDQHYMSVVHPAILRRFESRVNHIMSHDFNIFKYKVSEINYSVLPARQSLQKGFQDEVRAILRIANEDCAAKTDNLLTATDRLYGELNTSLMMELRKSSKRIDKANQSLFGSLVSASLAEKENLTIPVAGNYKFLYLALENLIVILLRATWIIVTVLKFFLKTVKIICKMVFFLC